MRRALLPVLPAWAELFGILPFHLDQMTYGEVSEFISYYNRRQAG